MFKFLMSLMFATLLFSSVQAAEVSLSDKARFETVIAGQLEAFKKDDGATAYSFAAPIVKSLFPNPDIFMAMVKRGYEPVYKNSKYIFGELAIDQFGRPAQHVIITADDGKRYEAVYSMQQQVDGSWKIAGCQMVEIPSVDA